MEDQLVDIGNLLIENNSAVDELGIGALAAAGIKAVNYQYNKTKERTKDAFEIVDNERFKEFFDKPTRPESAAEKAKYYTGRFISPEMNGRLDAIRERYDDIEIEEKNTEEALANHAYAEGMDTEFDYSSI